ncbi:hypothetical protein DSO57_1025954 [Entomophthora muscae]|uniref:Uncharacterized protein n=1 Tax=Entomophthora muscae TaxID=34485 RepID=A0ACC2SR72_9FUNG|nr:hypothetical protein DSO57_1025954 [Entomophthora muscae]
MLPKIVIEEIFSLLDRKQVYELRVLCLAFYQAAFPMLLRFHSLKQVKHIDYQRFLKKNGKHVEGLIVNHFNDYKALLSSGLSMSTVFPHLRFIKRLPYDPESPECKALIEDCLQLKKLKYTGLHHWDQPVLQFFAPLLSRLDSVFITGIVWRSQDNWEPCRGLKKLIVNSLFTFGDLNQILSKVPFEVEYITREGGILPLNTTRGNHTWVYIFIGKRYHFYLRLPHSPGYSKNMKSIGLSDVSSRSFIVIEEEHVFESIMKIPDFVDYFTVYTHNNRTHIFIEKYAPKFPSLHFYCCEDILYREGLSYQAASVSLGYDSFDGRNLSNLTSDRFPNLQNLYVSDTIRLETHYNILHGPGNSPLAIDFFPHLIRFSSKAPQAEGFWPRLLEAAPKLQYIHTNHKPRNLLELKNQRPFLQFMPYQDIFGESGELSEFFNFRI